MLTSVIVWASLADEKSSADVLQQVIAPILGTGLLGSLFLMLLFRIKIMPTYVYDAALHAWQEERLRLENAHATELTRLTRDNGDLKEALKEANSVYTLQVIPTLTRVLDSERELVELRRDEAAERRRRDR